MSEAFKCDRCGDLYKGKPKQVFNSQLSSGTKYSIGGMGACKNCTSKIVHVMGGAGV